MNKMEVTAVIGVAIVRIIMLIIPFSKKDLVELAMPEDYRKEAKEIMEAINARMVLLSFTPVALLLVYTKSAELCQSGGPNLIRTFLIKALLYFLVAFVLWVPVLVIPTRFLRGILPPFLIFLFVTIGDVFFQLCLLKPI